MMSKTISIGWAIAVVIWFFVFGMLWAGYLLGAFKK